MYMLDADGNPVPTFDADAHADWWMQSRRDRSYVIAQDRDEAAAPGGVLVSTVFLGIDHQYDDGPPVLWESLVFGGPLDGQQRRYTSRDAALVGHQDLCRQVAALAKVVE